MHFRFCPDKVEKRNARCYNKKVVLSAYSNMEVNFMNSDGSLGRSILNSALNRIELTRLLNRIQ